MIDPFDIIPEMTDIKEFKKVALDAVKRAEERIMNYFRHVPKIDCYPR